LYYQIIERGFYYEQVERYLDVFGKEKIKIFLFEELEADALQVLRSIFRFLGVDSSVRINVNIKANPYKRAKGVLKYIYHNQSLKRFVKKILPYALKEFMIKTLFDTNKPKMREGTEKYLRSLYRKEILDLQDLIGRDLRHWL